MVDEPRLPGLLTRAEIGSYRPGFGLCDSLTRKRQYRSVAPAYPLGSMF